MACGRWYVGLALCWCLTGCGGRHAQTVSAQSRSGVDPMLARTLQQTLDHQRRVRGLPGAAAAVLIPGKGLWSGGSGMADRSTGMPVRAQTPFAIASVTKFLVAAL